MSRFPSLPGSEYEEDDAKYNMICDKHKHLLETLPKGSGWRIQHLYNYNGFWLGPMTLKSNLLLHTYFKSEPTDIILASFMKSGTTWLKALMFSTLNRDHYSFSNHHLHNNSPQSTFPYLDAESYPMTDFTTFSAPRLFATHFARTLLPALDPKDILVSKWHFMSKLRSKDLPPLSFDEAFELFCLGVSEFGPFWEHVLSYWRASLESPDKILFLRYEELMKQPEVVVRKLADFMGKPVNKKGVEKFGKLVEVEKQQFFRKGEIGDWKNYLSEEMKDRIDGIIDEKFKGSVRSGGFEELNADNLNQDKGKDIILSPAFECYESPTRTQECLQSLDYLDLYSGVTYDECVVTCNKAGKPQSKRTFDTLVESSLNVRQSSFKVTDCPAHICVQLCKESSKFVVIRFVENHNHALVDSFNRDLLKSGRQLSYSTKQFTHNMSMNKIGPTISHWLQVSMKGGHHNVNGTPTDFKNFSRYVKLFVDRMLHYSVTHLDKRNDPINVFVVKFDKEDNSASCSCMCFMRIGYLCRHVFCVYRVNNVDTIPSRYIAERWTKDLLPKRIFDISNGYGVDSTPRSLLRFEILDSVTECVDALRSDDDGLSFFATRIRELKDHIFRNIVSNFNSKECNDDVIEDLLGITGNVEVSCSNPEGIRNKGTGKIRRIGSSFEKSAEKPKKAPRLCRTCFKYVTDHDSRNCKKKNPDSNTST
ncbi:hypothetical protein E3N88_35701 [Mikania micrantha]|uniref:SWIM-type domain-containing protein n=1 Tax=Mikania micrantha TaxID=192012 RepID=A0A5N6M266_9ASTR|nr:hypothetical protein E3N88_35701 [Mikania micrantha]